MFVACKGKVVLIVDTDGDGKADKEIVVADGWKEIAQSVDALGVAVDPKDGSVYFGRGTGELRQCLPHRQGRQGAVRR